MDMARKSHCYIVLQAVCTRIASFKCLSPHTWFELHWSIIVTVSFPEMLYD